MSAGIGHGDEKKIRFSAEDGISPFMKKIMNDQKALYNEFAASAKKQTDNQKEQLKLIEQQIKALERKRVLERDIAKEQVRQRVESGEVDYKRYAPSIKNINDDFRFETAGARMKERTLLNMLDNDKRNLREPKENITGSVFTGTLMANLVTEVVKNVSQYMRNAAHASSGFDMMPSAWGIGDAMKRSLIAREQLDSATYGYRALTGQGARIPGGMQAMGFDQIATAQTMSQIARARGGNGNGAAQVLGLDRGFGIDQSVTLGAIRSERMGGAGGLNGAQKGLGIAIAEGFNRSRYADVLTNQTALIQEFSKTSNVPSTDMANRTMFEFNRMGGPFQIGDPRSMGNIAAIQEGLSNPGSAFGQAQNYAVLRRLNPTAGQWELRKMQEQGLQTPGFLSGVLSDVMGGTGSMDVKKFQLKGRLRGLSMDAIDSLVANQSKLGSMSQSDLNAMLSDKAIGKEGNRNTSTMMRYEAEVADKFRESMVDGVKQVAEQFITEMKKAIKEIVLDMMGFGQAPDVQTYLKKQFDYGIFGSHGPFGSGEGRKTK